MKNNDSSRIKVPVLQDPTAALKEMAWLHQDTLYFTNAFIRSRCRPPKDSNGLNASAPITEAPVSPTELYRLQRALWRFWLVWAIVYRTPSIPQLWRRDTRGVAGDFVGRFTKWEIEELECVYYFLQDFYASSTGAIETPLPPDPERREKKRRIALQEFNKRRRAHRSLDMTAYPNEVEVSISISDPEGDEHKNSSSPFIHTQPNAIQRLLSATGYNTHAHCPLRLDKDKHIQAVLAILRRPVDRQFRQRDSINWMDAPTEANSANEGWKTYQRNAVYAIWEDYVNFDPNSLYPAASEWGRKPLMRFHGWGWCIWDQERLKRWGMLDEEGTVDVKRWYQGGVHGADDGEDAWESYWISLDKRLLHIPRCS
ncbi:MAG: hypothetical protein LQ346_004968 [Caloplaca aetnensis]|nr:MAG: hypothetical protein LQ346_004968 [Caloplaca aetnensis]